VAGSRRLGQAATTGRVPGRRSWAKLHAPPPATPVRGCSGAGLALPARPLRSARLALGVAWGGVTASPRVPPAIPPGVETLHFMCRVALAAWPLLLLSSALIVASVGLHLYQLRIQARRGAHAYGALPTLSAQGTTAQLCRQPPRHALPDPPPHPPHIQSAILNLATAGDRAAFQARVAQLARVLAAYLAASWLSGLALQIYLRRAMQALYTGGGGGGGGGWGGGPAVARWAAPPAYPGLGTCPPRRPAPDHTAPPFPPAGLFQHVLFQDSTFYLRVSASELAM
jgi:hypothetical protein